jgi:hypothetical protein
LINVSAHFQAAEAEEERLRQAKLAKKAAFDASYDDGSAPQARPLG